MLNCERAIEGKAKSYDKGTGICGMYVAQLHNQLIEAIINLENVIGDLGDTLTNIEPNSLMLASENQNLKSMNASLSHMLGYSGIVDDACPDVEFIFNMLTATEAEFCVRIFGSYLSYKLDFGDGNYTTTQYAGTYTYSISATINPIVTVTADNCCIVMQPSTSLESSLVPELPTPSVPFAITIPNIPDFPSFTAPDSTRTCPGPLFDMPPIINQLSCGSGCSGISLVDCCPSMISVECCDIPSFISVVGCNFPSFISVDWGTPPTLSCIISVQCCSSTPCPDSQNFAFSDGFNAEPTFMAQPFANVEVEDIGIPREIRLYHDVPREILVKTKDANIPEIIKVENTIPDSIYLNSSDVPRIIAIDSSSIPKFIELRMTEELKVTGIPDQLQVVGLPSSIEVKMIMPENPYVELIYKGDPIELNINVDISKNLSEIILVNAGK